MENSTDNNIAVHINSLFEIIKIVTASKSKFAKKNKFSIWFLFRILKIIADDSLKNLVITVLNFGIKRLKHAEYCVQALETLATIFNHGNYTLKYEKL